MGQRMKTVKIFLISMALVGCGVKGDPKPPLTPAALGHGQPSFKRITKVVVPGKTSEDDAVNSGKAKDSNERE